MIEVHPDKLQLSFHSSLAFSSACTGIHHPSNKQPGHRDEPRPENIPHLLILPEGLDHDIHISMQSALNQLRQEQDRRADERKRDLHSGFV